MAKPKMIYMSKAEPSLARLQELVGGYIEVVTLPSGNQLILDEEGKLKNKERNIFATKLWQGTDPNLWTDIIVGDVVHLSGKAKLT